MCLCIDLRKNIIITVKVIWCDLVFICKNAPQCRSISFMSKKRWRLQTSMMLHGVSNQHYSMIFTHISVLYQQQKFAQRNGKVLLNWSRLWTIIRASIVAFAASSAPLAKVQAKYLQTQDSELTVARLATSSLGQKWQTSGFRKSI